MIFYLCILFIICEAKAAQFIKGLYCQDPDTFKLYPVNATWPSETFCGNYTCKLRKSNNTETEYMPIKKIDITNNLLVRETTDMNTSPSENTYSVIEKLQPDKRPVFQKETDNKNNVNQIKIDVKNDRYLTEAEIKAITDVLHTVKKSDLEAIIEIYNLAQDIYKEIDGETTKNLVKETVNVMKEEANAKKHRENKKSYFYKPLHQTHMEKTNLTDMANEGTKTTNRGYPYPLTYFNGPVTNKDFGRTPYYYPMSNFQRSSSYVYNRPYPAPPTTLGYPKPPVRPFTRPPRPCTKSHFFPTPWYDQYIFKPYSKQQRPANQLLLPYPFSYVHHYNYSSYPSSYYYNNYPWAQLNSYNRHLFNSQYYGYSPLIPLDDEKVDIVKDKSSEEVKDDVESEAESTQPEWKTKPLSEKILDEVRANILDKSKLFKPLRKNVKLERVGKVIKLDAFNRSKRSVFDVKTDFPGNKVDVYETYIETKKLFADSFRKRRQVIVLMTPLMKGRNKIRSCEPSTDPGFFRVGNLSAPFPACCPQRIS